jgi:outer membrane protein OmpA-like peptidoglycan-associated protein
VVAAGGRELYDVLQADGRVATQGILFDTDSDVIRPESTPTLREIGEMLQEHGDMSLLIEGHTDSAGEADYNLELSESRAQSVVEYLVASYGIDSNRLAAAGFGESNPVGDNSTPEGRQQNRRVELVVQ